MRNKLLLLLVIALAGGATYLILMWRNPLNRDFIRWLRGDEATRQGMIVQQLACGRAPFVLPTDGFIGLYYGDPRGPYSRLRPHQGIDIFSNAPIGSQPVRAVADGYITRERDWVSTIIQKIENDPLRPGETLWVYYTHMADEAGEDFIEARFVPGSRNQFVRQGEIIGYVGNYDGNEPSRIWPHVHLSLVKDANGYLNESIFDNTLDPSPYFGRDLRYGRVGMAPVECDA